MQKNDLKNKEVYFFVLKKKKKLGVRTKWKREKPTGKNRAGNGNGREEPK